MDIASLIQKEVSIKGGLSFTKPLFFDGQIEGNLETTGSLTIGENGKVRGDIRARELVIWGRVEGNLFIEESCSLERDSFVNGDVKACILRMEEGATFNGMADIDPLRALAKEKTIEPKPVASAKPTDSKNDSPALVTSSTANKV
jgi:cytoskeletal protein CcmA (bactofilin family)